MFNPKLKSDIEKLTTEAANLRATIKDDTPPEQIAKIEQQHERLMGRLDATRKIAFDFAADESDRTAIQPYVSVGTDYASPDSIQSAIEESLYARISGVAPKGRGREFMGRRLIDIGREWLQQRGERIHSSESPERICQMLMTRSGMHTTSDFSVMLGNSMHRRLLELFRAADSGASMIASLGTASDFRGVTEGRLSSFPTMSKVNEHGEITFGTLDEEGETIQIASYARGISVSFQLLINDNLGALDRSIRDTGFAAAQLKASLITTALESSDAMADGYPLFHANHANLITSGAAAPSVSTLGSMRQLLRDQTGIDNETVLGLTPKVLLVPTDLETTAETLVAAIAPAETSNVNPFAGQLQLAVEPRLSSSTAWYLFADPNLYPTIKFLTLEGHQAPLLETNSEFTKLGQSYRITWHVGAGTVDHRGAAKNPGA